MGGVLLESKRAPESGEVGSMAFPVGFCEKRRIKEC